MDVDVIATGGHVCSFPSSLFPIGINLQRDQPVDPTRRISEEMRNVIIDAVGKHPTSRKILVAMDDDVEGDVIAFDLIEVILSEYPERIDHIWRLRPGALTHAGIRTALDGATPL